MNTPAYDPSNIFAKIIAGELPCYKIYEDDKTLAMLDIMPRADGHVLVLPKRGVRNILDCPAEDLAAVMATAQKIARASRRTFTADGISILLNNEAAGGQEVFHMHVHVIPRHEGIALRPPGRMAEPDTLKQHAEILQGAL